MGHLARDLTTASGRILLASRLARDLARDLEAAKAVEAMLSSR